MRKSEGKKRPSRKSARKPSGKDHEKIRRSQVGAPAAPFSHASSHPPSSFSCPPKTLPARPWNPWRLLRRRILTAVPLALPVALALALWSLLTLLLLVGRRSLHLRLPLHLHLHLLLHSRLLLVLLLLLVLVLLVLLCWIIRVWVRLSSFLSLRRHSTSCVNLLIHLQKHLHLTLRMRQQLQHSNHSTRPRPQMKQQHHHHPLLLCAGLPHCRGTRLGRARSHARSRKGSHEQ